MGTQLALISSKYGQDGEDMAQLVEKEKEEILQT